MRRPDFGELIADYQTTLTTQVREGNLYGPRVKELLGPLGHIAAYVAEFKLGSEPETWPANFFQDAIHWLISSEVAPGRQAPKLREAMAAFATYLKQRLPSCPWLPELIRAMPVGMLARLTSRVGGQKAPSTYTFSVSKAERRRAKLCLDDLGPNLTEFLGLIENFRDDMRLTKRANSPRTGSRYTYALRLLVHFLKSRNLDITPRQFDEELYKEFVSFQQLERHLSEDTVSGNLCALNRFYRQLAISRYTEHSPLKNVECAKKMPRLPRPMTVNEIEIMLGVFDTTKAHELRDLMVFELMYGSGLRIQETVTVKVAQFTLNERTLGSSVTVRGKNKIVRKVPISNPFQALLEQWVATKNLKPGDFVFGSKHARAGHLWAPSFERSFKIYLKRAGLSADYVPHMLRHAYGTHLADNGTDLRVIQELMGHSSMDSTAGYLLVSTRRKNEAYQKAHPRNFMTPTPHSKGTT
jgi:site-specific recombinase XerD